MRQDAQKLGKEIKNAKNVAQFLCQNILSKSVVQTIAIECMGTMNVTATFVRRNK